MLCRSGLRESSAEVFEGTAISISAKHYLLKKLCTNALDKSFASRQGLFSRIVVVVKIFYTARIALLIKGAIRHKL
jgi:hypothetical protein